MRIFFGIALCASVLGLAVVTVPHISPSLSARFGFDLADFIQAERQLQEALEHRRALNAEEARVLSSIETRYRVIRDLDEGRLTLLDAASQFRMLAQRLSPERRHLCQSYFGGDTEEECLCRQVIHFLECEIRDRPDGIARVASFQKELNELLRAGPIELSH